MTPSSRDAVASRLKEARIAAGFQTAAAAARRFGMKPATVRAHESAQNALSAEVATDYADAYGVSLRWLLSGDGERELVASRVPGPVKDKISGVEDELVLKYKNAILKATLGASTVSEEDNVAISYFSVMRALRMRLEPILGINDVKMGEQFWVVSTSYGKPLLLMACGANILSSWQEEAVRALIELFQTLSLNDGHFIIQDREKFGEVQDNFLKVYYYEGSGTFNSMQGVAIAGADLSSAILAGLRGPELGRLRRATIDKLDADLSET